MPAIPSAEILFVTPALLLALWLAPALAPVRRAFCSPAPALRLAPGEVLVAEVRPDAGLLRRHALVVTAATIAAALALQVGLGADPAAAYLPLLPFALAALARLALAARRRWRITDRRIVTELGAVLPLAEIGRIAVGPAQLRLDGRGTQSLRLDGLADAPGTARLVRALARKR